MPADLQPVEDAVIPRCEATVVELRDLRTLCREVPEWRKRKGRDYPLPCLLAIMIMATLASVVRGPDWLLPAPGRGRKNAEGFIMFVPELWGGISFYLMKNGNNSGHICAYMRILLETGFYRIV